METALRFRDSMKSATRFAKSILRKERINLALVRFQKLACQWAGLPVAYCLPRHTNDGNDAASRARQKQLVRLLDLTQIEQSFSNLQARSPRKIEHNRACNAFKNS